VAAGAESFAWRRAAAASSRPLPGAGAALFLYHRYFLAGTARPASDLAGFFLALKQGPIRGALAASFRTLGE